MNIRLATADDASGVLGVYAPIVNDTLISFEERPPGVMEMAERIERTLSHLPWIVAEEAGEIAGYAYASRYRARAAYRWSAEVSVYVSPAWQRRKLGTKLYEALFAVLRLQGYRMAYAGIALPNDGSVALHEGLGFESVGVFRAAGRKFETWTDVGWWALLLQTLGDRPQEPAPLPSLGLDAHIA
ncbi:MAG: arsinothricin resistance N-acetyltransferase ArsN1 family B [Pseudomonadota bacterium]